MAERRDHAPAEEFALDGFLELQDLERVTRDDAVGLPSGFRDAVRDVLDMLATFAPMGLWMLTRIESNTWTVLAGSDRALGIEPGFHLPFDATLCAVMLRGDGPRVAADTRTVDAYERIATPLGVSAYAGVEIVTGDGKLFGTLCAVDSSPRPLIPALLEPVLASLAALLSRILTTELALNESRHGYARAAAAAETDVLTGLRNRRGWDSATYRHSTIAKALSLPSAVIALDLDGLKSINDSLGHSEGDKFLCRAASAISESCRAGDTVARLGGDEFCVLLPDSGRADADLVVRRLRRMLRRSGIEASLGVACDRGVPISMLSAAADEAMYADKRSRRQHRGGLVATV